MHTGAFTQKGSGAFTRKSVYTETLFHRRAFTQRHFYTEELLHKKTFTQKNVYRQELLRRRSFTHRRAFTHRSFYTEERLHREAFTQKPICTHKLLHSKPFTHRSLFSTNVFTVWLENDNISQLSFLNIELHFVQKGLPTRAENRNFTSVFGHRSSFSRNLPWGKPENRNFSAFFGHRTAFRAKGLRFADPTCTALPPKRQLIKPESF